MPSRIVLGCGNFGGIGSSHEHFGQGESEEAAFDILSAAWDARIRWFDTADAYGGGRSETAIGKWIRATGNVPTLTTKTFNPIAPEADSGLAPDRIERQIESSLERLGVDRVDLYLAHEFDPEVPVAATVAAFERLVEQGVVGSWGYSNVSAAQLHVVLEHGRPAAVQNSFSLLEQRDAADLVPLCAEDGISYQAFSPLAGGWLTGKYRRGEPPPPGSRMTLRPGPYDHLRTDRTFDALERLEADARKRGVDSATLALAWVLAQPGVSGAIVGPRRPAHLDPPVRALGLSLTPEDAAALAALF